jgi:hypothetical protein
MGRETGEAGLKCVAGEAACVSHKAQHRLGVRFGFKEAVQGESRRLTETMQEYPITKSLRIFKRAVNIY